MKTVRPPDGAMVAALGQRRSGWTAADLAAIDAAFPSRRRALPLAML